METRSTQRPEPPESCPLDRYLQVMSGAWVPRIIWYLRFGPRRYGELQRDLGAISQKVLTEKLRALEMDGLVIRKILSPRPLQVEYSLSLRGQAFDPVFEAMTQVAAELDRLDTAEGQPT